MELRSDNFADGEPIPLEFAFGRSDPVKRIALSRNRNPHLAWADPPPGTRSFALICHDPDVPSAMDDVNQEGREVPCSLPRMTFYHWILFDLPPEVRTIEPGSHSDGIVARGKPGPQAPGGYLHGTNDYGKWFSGDPDMRGEYHGYDGPCPPWNDSIVHHYNFTLYALDVAHLHVDGALTGPNVTAALRGHVLAQATLVGTYSLNPRLISGTT